MENHDELRIGDVTTGVINESANAIRAEAAGRMARFGAEFPCRCVPLMPGDHKVQVPREKLFRELYDDCVKGALLEVYAEKLLERWPLKNLAPVLKIRKDLLSVLIRGNSHLIPDLPVSLRPLK